MGAFQYELVGHFSQTVTSGREDRMPHTGSEGVEKVRLDPGRYFEGEPVQVADSWNQDRKNCGQF